MALCKFPLHLKQAGGIVPCGQCFTCRLNKARFWTFRILMEARLHEKTFWTTITYDRVFIPLEYCDPNTGEYFSNPQGTLSPRDVELFLKRVRKHLPPKTLRYFLVGEYGDKNARPHYHICIFGYGEEIPPILERAWIDTISGYPLGFIDRKSCGPINGQNARYTVGYTLKKLTKANDTRLEGRYPEFIRNSKGIGMEFAKRFAASINNKSGLAHILATGDIPRSVRFDGKWWPLDRYLREKILEELGIKDVILQKGTERFKKEMRRLQNAAELNPKFSSAGTISPYVMEKQYQSETHQKVLNTETRAKLKMKEKPL